MTEDTSPENLRKFLESDDPALVRMGISLAKGAGVNVTVKNLERFLKSDDIETIKTGIMLADETGIGDEAMEELCEPLGNYDNDDVGSYCYIFEDIAGVLGNIGDVRAMNPLIEALGDNANWSMMEDTHNGEDARGAIAVALGNIGDQRAVDPLIKALFYGDGEYCVDLGRVAAAEALGKIGDARAVEPLIELWKVTGTWMESSQSSWEQTRWRATRNAIHEALEKIGQPAVALLIQILREDEVEEGRPEWYDASDDDSYVNGDAEALIRCFAAEALGNIGDTQAVGALIEALEDDDVRRCAAKVLDKLGWKPKTDGQKVAYLAAWGTLDELGWKPETDELRITLLLAEGDLDACSKFGEPAVKPLIKALEDDGFGIRQNAAEALGEIGDERAVEPLIEVLSDKDWYVRSSAAHALGEIGNKQAVKPLIELLGDEDDDVRDAAKEALKKLGHEVE